MAGSKLACETQFTPPAPYPVPSVVVSTWSPSFSARNASFFACGSVAILPEIVCGESQALAPSTIPSMTSTGSATLTVNRSPQDVWAAIADITRMGEWSPECTGGRWKGDATGPAVGAEFEGDNVAKVAGRTVKAWTTTSKVTACVAGEVFEFSAEGYTTWRYTFAAAGNGTTVTESFSYDPKGFQGFVYEKILMRKRMMTKGTQRTLQRVKTALESGTEAA